MKYFLGVLILSLLLLPPVARADGPDENYVAIYTLIQQADSLNEHGQKAAALTTYIEAETGLKKLQKDYPDWGGKVVKFRLNYLATKIALLSAPPATATATNSVTPPPVVPVAETPPAVVEPAKPVPSEAENQIKMLQEQLRNLAADKELLQAKLKEALTAQPAATNPQELAKAQDQIKNLQKENELLKVSLADAKSNVAAVVAANPKKLQDSLAEANNKVAQLTEANAALSLEKQTLQDRVKSLASPDSTVAALREENMVLRKQVSDLQGTGNASASTEELQRKLKAAEAQLAVLQSDKEILRLEKTTLENKVKQMASAQPSTTGTTPVTAVATPMVDSVTSNKVAQLEAQREELLKSLNAATKDIYGKKKGKETATRIDEMSRQMGTLRARIGVMESQPVPYTDAELALLNAPAPSLNASARSSTRKAVKQLPAGAAATLDEAKRYFIAHDLDKAEAKYLEVLKLDVKNLVTLADLASIQVELGHYADAENNLNTALGIEPDDDYSLFVMGKLKFRQKNYDEALDSLSRAARLNPQNAKVQNLLGLVLTEKGQRLAAETAFRKAIQLDPGYGEAHLNLAFVYITQQPPLGELARWHYQKALAAGYSANPGLEKLLDPGKAAAGGSR